MEQSYFEALMESLEEAIAFSKGDTSRCRVVYREYPDSAESQNPGRAEEAGNPA